MTETDTRTTVGSQIKAIWSRALDRKEIAADAQFVTLGGDSLVLLSILEQVESAFDVELDTEEVVQNLTIAGMTDLVLAQLA